jgi:alkylresorcinol/alkylpyrone synthase
MYLQSLATAFPERSFTQEECLHILEGSGALEAVRPRSRDILRKVLKGDSGIVTRNLSSEKLENVFRSDAGALHRLFEKEAPRLASEALLRACLEASVRASEIDALLVCTCTGYLCPGLSSYISERLGMRPNAFLQDLLGLGCGAAIPMLEAARGITATSPGAVIATVAVEISSAAFYLDDDPGVLISLCLFGDGAAAALWRSENRGAQLRFSNFRTLHKPEHREKIRFVNANGRLKNQLHRSVPELAAEAVGELYAMRSADPERIIAHTGGRDVIEAIERRIPAFRLDETRTVLSSHGNISSPSVLVALKEALSNPRSPGNHFWLTSFGAGFAAHSCELRRDRE